MNNIIVTVTFTFVDKILWCYHSKETSLAKLLRSISCLIVRGFYKENDFYNIKILLFLVLGIKGLIFK